MKSLLTALTSAAVMLLAIGGGAFAGDGGNDHGSIAKQAATGELKAAKATETANGVTVTKTMPFLSDSAVAAAKPAVPGGGEDERAVGADVAAGDLGQADLGQAQGTLGCSRREKDKEHGDEGEHGEKNVRVNQDCTFRRQAEEDIIFNPADPKNLLAGQNDSRVGFNQCGIDWSTDNGQHWGDLLPPFRQKLNRPQDQRTPVAGDKNTHTILGNPGTNHTYDAGSDPTVAFDSAGRGFFSCVIFDVNSDASALYVTLSPKGANGSFFFNIPSKSRSFIVAEDNSSEVFHDKQFIVADTNASSPNRDNVYVTWTVFRFSPTCGPQPNPNLEERYCQSPIFGSMSTDNAQHWSTPELISGTSDTLCFFGNFFQPTQNPHSCNFDQGSEPVVLPNGDLEVVFNNGNTAATNPNAQQLGVHCRPTGSSPAGTAHLNCASPSKVGDDVIVGEPQCNFGRGPEECIPGAFIRTNDFPRIIGNPLRTNHLYATWQDYRNGEFDIQLSQSLDGGLTWKEIGTVNPDRGLDHYFPAVDVVRKTDSDNKGDRVGDSYFRTERVPNENTTPTGGFAPGVQPGVGQGNSDYALAGGTAPELPFDFRVLSPVFPPPDGVQRGFNGDYSGLTINREAEAHPIWSDTRNADPFAPANGVAHDEDIFTTKVEVPNGKAKVGPGRIGKDK